MQSSKEMAQVPETTNNPSTQPGRPRCEVLTRFDLILVQGLKFTLLFFFEFFLWIGRKMLTRGSLERG